MHYSYLPIKQCAIAKHLPYLLSALGAGLLSLLQCLCKRSVLDNLTVLLEYFTIKYNDCSIRVYLKFYTLLE